jgi:Ferritin-like domain
MFDQKFISSAITRSAESSLDRRRFLTVAGIAGVGAATAVLASSGPASAAGFAAAEGAPSDSAILNFALNLEYLEAEFYLRATTGSGLPDNLTTGKGKLGKVTGGKKVNFDTRAIRNYAEEISADEKSHVAFLRTALGGDAVSRPEIDLSASFTAAAQAAGVVKKGETFDPYANEVNFLFAAFLFEDVGVTAYKGAAPLISNKTYLDAAAGILAVEAYHAGIVRSALYQLGLDDSAIYKTADKLSDARDSLDGSTDLDQGIGKSSKSNLVPTDSNALAYSRSAGQVLNIVYLNPNAVSKGGFYPVGMNGEIVTSAAPA